jgi:hypothetical protein
MSVTVNVPTDAAERINPPREQQYLWTTVLILGTIAACAIATSFYLDAPLLDASMAGP